MKRHHLLVAFVASSLALALPSSDAYAQDPTGQQYSDNLSQQAAAEQQRQHRQTVTTNAPASAYRSTKGTWVDFPAGDASPEYKAAWKRAHRARKADKPDAKAAKTRQKQRREGQEALRDLQKYNAEQSN